MKYSRNYIIALADRTSFYVPNKDGKAALDMWSQGKPIVVRGCGYAHHMVSVIRPCNFEEEQAANDELELEGRREALTSGKVEYHAQIIEGGREKEIALGAIQKALEAKNSPTLP